MKPLRFKTVVCLGLCLLAAALGCARKKVATAPSPPPIALPEATPSPQPQEPAQTQTQTSTQGTPPPSPDQTEPANPANEDAEKAKAKNGKAHSTAKKPAPPAPTGKTAESAHNVPPRTVVKSDGSESSPTPGTISPSPSQGGNNDQATTEQLLQNTETNLTGIKRQLSKDEEVILSQIKDYLGQSRQAIKDNDLERAHMFAWKAHLLCDDLMKRR